jgi:hypothetical protein
MHSCRLQFQFSFQWSAPQNTMSAPLFPWAHYLTILVVQKSVTPLPAAAHQRALTLTADATVAAADGVLLNSWAALLSQ